MANSCVKMTSHAPWHSCVLMLHSFTTTAWWILALLLWNMPEPSGKKKFNWWVTWSFSTFRNSADLLCLDQTNHNTTIFWFKWNDGQCIMMIFLKMYKNVFQTALCFDWVGRSLSSESNSTRKKALHVTCIITKDMLPLKFLIHGMRTRIYHCARSLQCRLRKNGLQQR